MCSFTASAVSSGQSIKGTADQSSSLDTATMSLPVIYSFLCLCLLGAVKGQQVYMSTGQAQSTKMAPMVYYKPKETAPKVTTIEPSTEPSQQQYYSMGENYYQDYKVPSTNGPQKYSHSDYGEQTSEAPPASDYTANTTPPSPSPPSNPGDIQGHLENLLKLLLTSKVSSPKFLLLLPLTGKGGPAAYAKPESPPAPTTVKPKPRKKTKYIVVN